MRFFLTLTMCVLTLLPTGDVFAQQEEKRNIIYERPNNKTLSQLYWRMLKMDPEDEQAVDF